MSNLTHLFDAVKKKQVVLEAINTILSKKEPIVILLEGSSYTINVDVLDKVISSRNNQKDLVFLIDINASIVSKHHDYIKKRFSQKNYKVVQSDMNLVPLSNNSVDLIINNFTVNYNSTNRDDRQTLNEIRRLLKTDGSACLFSVGATENNYKGKSYESKFYYTPSNRKTAKLYQSSSYYKTLFGDMHFHYIEFDIVRSEKKIPKAAHFPYSRFLLTPYEQVISK